MSAPAAAPTRDPRARLYEAETLILTAQHRASDECVDRLDWLDRDLIARDLSAALALIAEARRLIAGEGGAK